MGFSFFLKRPVVILLFGLIIVWGYFNYFKNEASAHGQPPTKVVEAQAVSVRDIRKCVSLIGVIKPRQSTPLSVKASGILKLHAKAGDRVAKGSVLASVEDTDIEKKYELAKEAEEIAKDRFERALKLHEAMSISSSALEEKKSAWLEAQRGFYDAKSALENLKVTAPFEGIVGSFRQTEGFQMHAGDRIATFYDPSLLRIDFDVPSSILVAVKQEAPVGVNGKWYTLSHLDKMIEEETHMARAYVDIPCEGFCDIRAIGTTVDIELCIEEKKETLVIPFEAIFFQNGRTCVYKLNQDETVLEAVEMGIRYKENVEILSGLEAGDLIVVRGQSRLYPGLRVEVKRLDVAAEER